MVRADMRKLSTMENRRFVLELDKFVNVDSDGINQLSARDRNWLAMRDAKRHIAADAEFGDRRVPLFDYTD